MKLVANILDQFATPAARLEPRPLPTVQTLSKADVARFVVAGVFLGLTLALLLAPLVDDLKPAPPERIQPKETRLSS